MYRKSADVCRSRDVGDEAQSDVTATLLHRPYPVRGALLVAAPAPDAMPDRKCDTIRDHSLGGVPRDQKMLKGHLSRVICHQVY